MRSYLSHFNKQSQADAADMAAALVGVSNGRNHGVLERVDTDLIRAGSDKNKKSDLVDYILTQNPEYAAIFENTMQHVREAETAVDRVLEIAAARFKTSQAKFDDLMNKAAELPDGDKIARSEKDGLVYTFDGQLVDADQAADIEWTGREPSLEDIQAAEERAAADFDVLTNARVDEVRLGEIREELQTKPDADRVKDLGEEAEAIKARNDDVLNSLNAPENSNSQVESQFTVSTAIVPEISV